MRGKLCKLFERRVETSKALGDLEDKLEKIYRDMGCNAELFSKSATLMAYETSRLETDYKIVSELHKLEDCLKPCPVCGEKPRLQMTDILTHDFQEQTSYQIGCPKRCGQVYTALDVNAVIAGWNRYAVSLKRPAIKPKSTNCPNCGAPVDIHAEKCAYCDTPYLNIDSETSNWDITFKDGSRVRFVVRE